MADDVDTPIIVNSNPLPAQAMAALRTILIAAGAYMTGRGWITERDMATLSVVLPAALTLGTFVWSQWATRKNAKRLAVVAIAAPNRVAQVK